MTVDKGSNTPLGRRGLCGLEKGVTGAFQDKWALDAAGKELERSFQVKQLSRWRSTHDRKGCHGPQPCQLECT